MIRGERRAQCHADAAWNDLAELDGPSPRTPHLLNTHFDFELPPAFATSELCALHREALVGHDAAELARTEILELFNSVRGALLIPLGTDADGDCLLHSAAIGMWGVHWERSEPESGRKPRPDALNLFSFDESPMRASMLECRNLHRNAIFYAWSVYLFFFHLPSSPFVGPYFISGWAASALGVKGQCAPEAM